MSLIADGGLDEKQAPLPALTTRARHPHGRPATGATFGGDPNLQRHWDSKR
jgi:hypothetical protein